MSQLEDIKGRAEKATPGPWVNDGDGVHQGMELAIEVGPHSWERVGVIPGEYVRDRDAEFIAHARTDAPKLIAALEAVGELAEQWRYKGEFGWGAWQEGHGPDLEGWALDQAASEIRQAIKEALQ